MREELGKGTSRQRPPSRLLPWGDYNGGGRIFGKGCRNKNKKKKQEKKPNTRENNNTKKTREGERSYLGVS